MAAATNAERSCHLPGLHVPKLAEGGNTACSPCLADAHIGVGRTRGVAFLS